MPEPDNASWRSQGLGHWLVVAWQDALGRVFDRMGTPEAVPAAWFHARFADTNSWLSWPSPIWCRLAVETVPGGTVSAGCPQQTAQALARLMAREKDLTEGECREAFLEVVNQTAAAAGTAISERSGSLVQFSRAQFAEVPDTLDYAVQIEFSFQGETHAMALVTNARLLEAPGAPPKSTEIPVLSPAPLGNPQPAFGAPGNLDLLLEVELPVCVTFGRTQLALKEVLKLSSGSIVELNRLANEPVEILINDCVIARGEVVVVDGNYGIRLTEIVSRQERIRSIF